MQRNDSVSMMVYQADEEAETESELWKLLVVEVGGFTSCMRPHYGLSPAMAACVLLISAVSVVLEPCHCHGLI